MASKNNQPGDAAPSADTTGSLQADSLRLSSGQALRRQAEAKLIERKKKAAALPAPETDTQRFVHELEVHQIELEMQNEELLQSHAQVEAGLRQYTDLYDFVPVGYFTLALDGAIHQINLAGANLLGAERGALIKRRFGVFVSARSRTTFSAFLEKVFSTSGSKETCEIALQEDGSAPLWVHIEAMTEDGQRKTCRAAVVDITERKQAEEHLTSHHALLEAIINSPRDIIIYSLDTNYRYIAFNEKHRREMKAVWNVDIQIGMNPLDCMNIPELQNLAKQSMDRVLRGESFSEEQHQPGPDIYYDLSWNPVLRGKEVIGLSAFVRDITGRKMSEEEIKNLAKFPSENPSPILRIARDGTLLYTNQAGLSLLPDWHLQVGQAAPPKLREAAFQVMDSGGSTQMLDLECRQRIYSFFLVAVVGASYANFYGRDVTERKRAEMELLEAKALVETIVEHIPLMIFLKEATDLRFVIFNRAGLELLGYDRKALIGKNDLDFFPPEQAAHFMAKDRETLAGHGVVDIPEEFIQTAKKGLRVLHTRKISIMGGDGIAKYLLGISEDVTESKKSEAHLRETLLGLRNALGGVIQVLSAVSEKRDPYTAGHQRRVADLAQAIAQELGLPPDRVEGIRVAGVIHDIGKMSVPAEILSKPTRLSEIEYKMIQSHAQIGHDILGDVKFSWPIANIILQHHERMDGSGYPQGLKGDDILLESRILAVSDVVEAMASHRPYRPALGIEAALQEIENNKGVLYDPAVVSACLTLFREKSFEFKP